MGMSKADRSIVPVIPKPIAAEETAMTLRPRSDSEKTAGEEFTLIEALNLPGWSRWRLDKPTGMGKQISPPRSASE
jgi:hypothetical protein